MKTCLVAVAFVVGCNLAVAQQFPGVPGQAQRAEFAPVTLDAALRVLKEAGYEIEAMPNVDRDGLKQHRLTRRENGWTNVVILGMREDGRLVSLRANLGLPRGGLTPERMTAMLKLNHQLRPLAFTYNAEENRVELSLVLVNGYYKEEKGIVHTVDLFVKTIRDTATVWVGDAQTTGRNHK